MASTEINPRMISVFVLPRFSRNKLKQTHHLEILALSRLFLLVGDFGACRHVVEVCLTSTNSILKAPCPSQLYKLDGESGNLLSFPGALHFGCRSRQPTNCFRLPKNHEKKIHGFVASKTRKCESCIDVKPTSFTEGDAQNIQQVYGQQVLRCLEVV